ncbi:unnamed protein product [Amoebophrya sp. A120]|nr:unnamed protein product [Amoebophrya sp. A120]|eukprot:GSA120T00014010001.1
MTDSTKKAFKFLDPVSSRNRCYALHQLRLDADCDALIILLGSDGRSHRGSELVFLYSLLGKTGPDLILEELSYDDIPFGTSCNGGNHQSALPSGNGISAATALVHKKPYNLKDAEKIGVKEAKPAPQPKLSREDDPWADFDEQFGLTESTEEEGEDEEKDGENYVGGGIFGTTGGSSNTFKNLFGSCTTDWDEVFIILHMSKTFVFAPNHTIAEQLHEVMCLWPNLEVFNASENKWSCRLECINEKFLNDPKGYREGKLGDDYDLIKIKAFIQALNYPEGFGAEQPGSQVLPTKEAYTKSVGVFGKSIEQWPLVQAYALDEFGNHGFLSMKKKVKNLESELEFLFSNVGASDVVYCKELVCNGTGTPGDQAVMQDTNDPLLAAFKESFGNFYNRDACCQLWEYGELNNEEVLDNLPYRKSKVFGAASTSPSTTQVQTTVTECPNFIKHEVYDPKWKTFFARTIPTVFSSTSASDNSSPTRQMNHELLSKIALAKHCVDAFMVKATSTSSAGIEMNQNASATTCPSTKTTIFPLFDSILGKSLATAYREWLFSQLGEHVTKQIGDDNNIKIEALDSFGYPLDTTISKPQAGTVLVTVKVEIPVVDESRVFLPSDSTGTTTTSSTTTLSSTKVVWGDSFLYTKAAARAPGEAIRITGDKFPSPFSFGETTSSENSSNKMAVEGEEISTTQDDSSSKTKPVQHLKELSSTTADHTTGVVLCLPTSKLTEVSASLTSELKQYGTVSSSSSATSTTSSLCFIGSKVTDLKPHASQLALYSRKAMKASGSSSGSSESDEKEDFFIKYTCKDLKNFSAKMATAGTSSTTLSSGTTELWMKVVSATPFSGNSAVPKTALQIKNAVYCKATLSGSPEVVVSDATAPPPTGAEADAVCSFFVRIPNPWLSTIGLRVSPAEPEFASPIVRELFGVEESFFAKSSTAMGPLGTGTGRNKTADVLSSSTTNTTTTPALQNFLNTVSLTDSHLARMPPNSRRAAFGTPGDLTESYSEANLLWINTLPNSTVTFEFAENLAKREKKKFFSVRERLALANKIGGDSTTSSCTGNSVENVNTASASSSLHYPEKNAVILNDSGLALIPPTNAHCVTDLRDFLGIFTPSTVLPSSGSSCSAEEKSQISSQLVKNFLPDSVRSLLEPGFCTVALLPNSTSYQTAIAVQQLEHFVKAVNPKAQLLKADEYFSSRTSASASDAFAVAHLAKEKLVSRPGCLDNNISDRSSELFSAKDLMIVKIDVKQKLFDFEKLKVTLTKELVRNKNLISIELKNVLTAEAGAGCKMNSYCSTKEEGASTTSSSFTIDAAPVTVPTLKRIKSGSLRLGEQGEPNNWTIIDGSNDAELVPSSLEQILFWLYVPAVGEGDQQAQKHFHEKLTTYFDQVLLSKNCTFQLFEQVPKYPSEAELHLHGLHDEKFGFNVNSGRLPDGWHFDGDYYVNFQGIRQKRHPEWDQLCDFVVEKRKAEAELWNGENEKFLKKFGLGLVKGGIEL